jgi:hypothetical protein
MANFSRFYVLIIYKLKKNKRRVKILMFFNIDGKTDIALNLYW